MTDLDKENPDSTDEVADAVEEKVFVKKVDYNTVVGNTTYSIALPSTTIGTAADIMDNSNVAKTIDDHKNGKEWASVIYKGIRSNVYEDQLEPKDGNWSNDLEFSGKDQGITAITPRSRDKTAVSGKEAKAILMSKLGLGAHVTIPLYHSGFRITISPPSESNIIELYRRFTADMVTYGRETTGMVFSNSSVIAIKNIIEMLVENNLIHSTTISGWRELNLTDYIKATDINPLLTGITAAMYPKGFTYKRACINNPESCTTVVTKKINPSKLLVVNKDRLNDDRKTQIGVRVPEKLSPQVITDYQETASFNASKRIKLSPKDSDKELYITFRVPSITEELEAGMDWVGELETLLEQVVEEEDEDKRIVVLNTHVAATIMRTYAHWVENIEIDGFIISTPSDINESLDLLSGDDDIRSHFLEIITEYINQSVIAIVAIPAFNCPSPDCKAPQDTEEDKIEGFDDVIPINPLNVFFDLAEQRVRQIRER